MYPRYPMKHAPPSSPRVRYVSPLVLIATAYALAPPPASAQIAVPFDSLFARAYAHRNGPDDSTLVYVERLRAYADATAVPAQAMLADWYEGRHYVRVGEADRAVEKLSAGLARMPSAPDAADSLALFRLLSERSVAYGDLGRPERDRDDRRRARAVVERLDAPHEHLVFLLNQVGALLTPQTLDSMRLAYRELDSVYNAYGRPARDAYLVAYYGGQVHIGLRQFDIAEDYFEEAARVAAADAPGGADVLRARGGQLAAVFTSGDYARTRRLHAELEPLFATSDDLYIRLFAADMRLQVDTVLGDYRSALDSYAALVALKDTLAGQARQERVDELEATFAVERQARQIDSLEAGQQIAALFAERQHSRLVGLCTLLVVAGVFSGLLYRRYRQVRRARAEIEAQRAELAAANARIGEELEARTLLMQEIHHRAKNNLTTIEALLNLQLKSIGDATATSALVRSRERIRAVSLIHEQLYRRGTGGAVDAAEYLGALVTHLGTQAERTRLEADIASVELELSQAVAVGLLVNEAVVNSLEHASGSAAVTVRLREDEARDLLHLEIADDGVGFPDAALSDRPTQGGLFLVRGLAQQLGGELALENDGGARVRLSFPRAVAVEAVGG